MSASVLKSPKGDAVLKFEVDYDRYLRQLDQINANIVTDAQKVRIMGYKSY